MKKIVVIKVVSSPSIFHSLFLVFLIYSRHFSQTIFETLRQGHCTIIIYLSTILIKNFEKNDCEIVHGLVKLQNIGP